MCQQCTQKNPFIDDNMEDLSNQDRENDDNWPDLTENELKNAISLFNPKKACGPDAIKFTIVQKSFQSLINVFMIYSKFIRKRNQNNTSPKSQPPKHRYPIF